MNRRTIRRRTGPIKTLLLDQSFATGVGNWLADEMAAKGRKEHIEEGTRDTESGFVEDIAEMRFQA